MAARFSDEMFGDGSSIVGHSGWPATTQFVSAFVSGKARRRYLHDRGTNAVVPILQPRGLPSMHKRLTRSVTTIVLYTGLFIATSHIASAATTPDGPDSTAADPAAAAAAADDDDAALDVIEPDFRVINLPTTLRLPRYKGDFTLTHRFGGNLRSGSFSDQAGHLFGIDEGATVGFEFRFGLARHLQGTAYRTTFNRTIQLGLKYDALHQSAGMPLSVSGVFTDEGIDNYQHNHAQALGASVSRKFGDVVAVYAVPMWVHNTAAGAGIDRDTGVFGLGGRLRIRPTVYVSGEVSPRIGGYDPGDNEYGFAIEKRVGGHLFQLNFTNTLGTTSAQLARGGAPNNLQMGFNLIRKFY
jgi:hypothetical protein